MYRNKNSKNTKTSNFASACFVGILLSVIVSITLSLGAAFTIEKEILDENNISGVIFIIQTISVFSGSILIMSLLKDKKPILSISVMICYVAVQFIAGAIISKCSFINFGSNLLSASLGFVIAYGMQLTKASKKKYAIKHIR